MPASLLAILLADKPSHREINKLKLASLKMPTLHTHCGLGEPTGSAALATLGPIAKLEASKSVQQVAGFIERIWNGSVKKIPNANV
tara:strand:- start:1 stop:258 length:258 start_codon:yes stop_codon:yes gene_type:complete